MCEPERPGFLLYAVQLLQGRTLLLAGDPGLVLKVGTFVGMANAEIEHLLPPEVIIRELDRWQRAASVPFADEYKIVLYDHVGVTLSRPGCKPDLAKRVKQQLLADGQEVRKSRERTDVINGTPHEAH